MHQKRSFPVQGTYSLDKQNIGDLEVTFFAQHIRAITESDDSKLAGLGNPLFRKLDMFTLTEG